MDARRILVLGAGGMLGHVLFTELARREGLDVHATARRPEVIAGRLPPALRSRVQGGADARDLDAILGVIGELRPSAVVNCVGVVKQLAAAEDPLVAIPVNALFPHRLARACRAAGARLVHVSTDCVFSGRKGRYIEEDRPDAEDLYGRTKLLGEVTGPGCLTLRTSIIGHELSGRHGLIEWFLAQEGPVRGFAGAVYSGFPTVELARIVADHVLPTESLTGLYHVSSDPVTKFELLGLVAARYGRRIAIERDEGVRCDRSLDSSRFRRETGYSPPPWPELVARMHAHYAGSGLYGTGVNP